MFKMKKVFSMVLAVAVIFGCMTFNTQAVLANDTLPRASAAELAKIEATLNELRLSIEESENEVLEDSATQSAVVAPSSQSSDGMRAAAAEYIKWQWTLSVSKNEIKVYCDLIQGTFPLLSASATIEVRDANGNLTASYPISHSLPFYNKDWTWSKPISTSTVEETVTLVNTKAYYDIGQYGTTANLSVNRNNFVGGAYNAISALDGERHHMFATYVYDNTTVNRFDFSGLTITGQVYKTGAAPVILMNKKDHQKTASWGSSAASLAHRTKQLNYVKAGQYYDALMMDFYDIQAKFGTKYDCPLSMDEPSI